jgi:hypothetical protein
MRVARKCPCEHLYSKPLATEVTVPLFFKFGIVPDVVKLSAGAALSREQCSSLFSSSLPCVRLRPASQLIVLMMFSTARALTLVGCVDADILVENPVLATVGAANDSVTTHAAGTPP